MTEMERIILFSALGFGGVSLFRIMLALDGILKALNILAGIK